MDRNQLANDPVVSFRYALNGNQATIWTAIPAIVQSVNLTAMTLVAQPAIQGIITSPDPSNPNNFIDTYVNLPLLADVPILYPSGGGFTLTFPITVGDEVLVHFSSRCIDSWWQNGGIGVPIEMRMHDLSDGFAFCGPKSQPNVVGGISSNSTQLRTNSGAVFLEITSSGVNILGNLKVTGTITSTVDVIAGPDSISAISHVHSDVANGPSDTGPPVT